MRFASHGRTNLFDMTRGGADKTGWPGWTRHATSRGCDERCQDNLLEKWVQPKTEEVFWKVLLSLSFCVVFSFTDDIASDTWGTKWILRVGV